MRAISGLPPIRANQPPCPVVFCIELNTIKGVEYLIQQTEDFADWRAGIKDRVAATAILRRMDRAQAGNLGDVKPVGGGVSEMRVDVGAGYRLYFTIRDRKVLFLLAGGDKSTQKADIRRAIEIAREI